MPAVPPRAAADPAGTAATRRPQATTTLAGRVMAPANVLGGAKLIGSDGATLVGLDGASLSGADGASLVGSDGASLTGAGRGLLAVTERACAGAEVVLTDADGKPVPGVKPVLTGVDGGFKVFGVPPGSFRVQAGVRTAAGVARLETLVRSDARAGGAEISAASTLVTRLVAGSARLGAMDMQRFSEAVAACAQALDDRALPEWADQAGVDRAAQAALAASAEMRPMIETLAPDLDAVAGPAATAAGSATRPASPLAPSAASSGGPKVGGPPTLPIAIIPSPAPIAAASPVATAMPTATPSPVEEVHDPRLEFRETEAGASGWSYYWLDGTTPRPMGLVPPALAAPAAPPMWIGGTDVRTDGLTGQCYAFADAQNFVLDPSTTKLEGAAAAWTAPTGGTVRIVGNVEVNATTVNGVTVSVRNGETPVVTEVLDATRTGFRLDSGTFGVGAGARVWLWAQPRAMPEVTDVTRFQLQLIFTRPGP